MSDNCLFCKIAAGDIPADKIYEDELVLALRDISPQAPVHFLVIPKKHLKGPGAIDINDETLAGHLVRVAGIIAARENISDYRLVFNNGAAAGQTIFHLHLHVIGGRAMTWPPG